MFVEEVTFVTSFKEVSGKLSNASTINVESVERIRRKRSARLKGIAFLVFKGWQDE